MKTKNQRTILINNKFFFLAFIFITIQVLPVFSQTQKTDVQLTLKPGHLNYKDNATEIIGIDSSYNITTDTGYLGAEHYCNQINNVKPSTM